MQRSYVMAGAVLATALATPAQADVVIGPRVSYYFDNSNLRTSDLDGLRDALQVIDADLTGQLREASGFDDLTVEVQDNGSASNSDQVGFAMVGGMVNFGGDRDRFTVIAMYGSGEAGTELVSSRNVTLSVADVQFTELSIIQTVTAEEVDRLDLELTWQRRVSENFAMSAGARYERLAVTGAGTLVIQQNDEVRQFVADVLGEDAPTRNIDALGRPDRIATERSLETFSGRAGVTAFVPFSAHAVAFFNGMVHASHQPASTFETRFLGFDEETLREEERRDAAETSIGPDFAVGAQFILTDSIALDIRYRAIMFFPLSGDFDFGDSRVNHGVNLGVSLRL